LRPGLVDTGPPRPGRHPRPATARRGEMTYLSPPSDHAPTGAMLMPRRRASSVQRMMSAIVGWSAPAGSGAEGNCGAMTTRPIMAGRQATTSVRSLTNRRWPSPLAARAMSRGRPTDCGLSPTARDFPQLRSSPVVPSSRFFWHFYGRARPGFPELLMPHWGIDVPRRSRPAVPAGP